MQNYEYSNQVMLSNCLDMFYSSGACSSIFWNVFVGNMKAMAMGNNDNTLPITYKGISLA
jgi:hypothetical protein